MTREEADKRIQKAVELFMSGFGCGQSVVAAFADLYGIDQNTALRLGNGFGGGVGKMRMMCGAVSGMVILAGLDSDEEDKPGCYKLVQDLLASFKEENGSVICAELLGIQPVSGDHTPSERNAEYYKARPCAAKVESAARIFAGYLISR